MKFFTAVAAFAGLAAAHRPIGTGVAYTTVTSTAFVTYCPEATSFEYNHETYTVTEATTLTITNCPDNACTWVQPITTSISVSCSGSGTSCGGYGNGTVPHYPTGTPAPAPAPVGCTGYDCNTGAVGGDDDEPEVAIAGAGRVAAWSGAALAGVLAIAAAL